MVGQPSVTTTQGNEWPPLLAWWSWLTHRQGDQAGSLLTTVLLEPGSLLQFLEQMPHDFGVGFWNGAQAFPDLGNAAASLRMTDRHSLGEHPLKGQTPAQENTAVFTGTLVLLGGGKHGPMDWKIVRQLCPSSLSTERTTTFLALKFAYNRAKAHSKR